MKSSPVHGPAAFLRVVRLRRGKLKAVEFRIRKGERGLSLFAHVEKPGPPEIIEAVRSAGKQGELAVVELDAKALAEMGLKLVPCKGGTDDPVINSIHYEARLPVVMRIFVMIRGLSLHEYFNERFSERLRAICSFH